MTNPKAFLFCVTFALLPLAGAAGQTTRAQCGSSMMTLHAEPGTHTRPPYPAISQRMGEQGESVLRLRIGGDGRVQEASVAVSSGSARLDQAAMEHVRLRWRWRPACSNAMTEVTITWRLIDADAQDEAGR